MSIEKIHGEYVAEDNQEYYKINNYHLMNPFFICLASNCDIWLFSSSNGALTAGRKHAEDAVFPYETEDKIHSSCDTGPKTVIRVRMSDGSLQLWEPFSKGYVNPYKFERNIYKNTTGNSLIFEEINHTLRMIFRYQWNTSEKFGIIRTSSIISLNEKRVGIEIIDGITNILPYGIPLNMQNSMSCLSDAYKSCELDTKTGLAIFSLTSKIVDTPEPAEILRANVAWHISDKDPVILLSTNQLREFCNGKMVKTEADINGMKGCYLLSFAFELENNQKETWKIISDVKLSRIEISNLERRITDSKLKNISMNDTIIEDIDLCTAELIKIVAKGDGMQFTNDKKASIHHFTNVLYNEMRGGVFLDSYEFSKDELMKFINIRNKCVYRDNHDFFDQFMDTISIVELKEKAIETRKADLIRLCYEFLPLSFSRRHGDPSRPWNRFFIDLKDSEGRNIYKYEGNWRDIFQNWEALCLSFPEYLDNIIAKFLNASTIDGYNPYRMNQNGFEWETINPEDPWGSIGYWGDHQVIYLLKLLEAQAQHNKSKLIDLLDEEVFSYANIPYEIKSYDDLMKDNKNTIIFNGIKNNQIEKSVESIGSDAKLVLKDQKVYYVNLTEKLLVQILSKLSNFVVDGGIWMNTQRPEWNDANNAIVGNGLSMVTTYHLRRHISFCLDLISTKNDEATSISNEVLSWFNGVSKTLVNYRKFLDRRPIDSGIRKTILDELGSSFCKYRTVVYKDGYSKKAKVTYKEIANLLLEALGYIDHTIRNNRCSDGTYSTYNTFNLSYDSKKIEINGLYTMLEGQTAVLNSLMLSGAEVISLTDTMERSDLYCSDQHAFYLYPKKILKKFMQKNIVPESCVKSSGLIQLLLKNKNREIVLEDIDGNVVLNPDFQTINDLVSALEKMKNNKLYKELVIKDLKTVMDIYENIFKHTEFTGRSGVMYKYEGIGCIYWHQNSKFLLALQECFYKALENHEDMKVVLEIKKAYFRLREGLGFNKEPLEWGAFPFDPYSHTAYNGGAQQPGMTGQVKEEILTRRNELGLNVKEGLVQFSPYLLREEEFFSTKGSFNYIDMDGNQRTIELIGGTLAFSAYQVPVIYKLSNEPKIKVFLKNDSIKLYNSYLLDRETSTSILKRKGEVSIIEVYINKQDII